MVSAYRVPQMRGAGHAEDLWYCIPLYLAHMAVLTGQSHRDQAETAENWIQRLEVFIRKSGVNNQT